MWPLYFPLKIISTVENGCTLLKTCLKLTYLRNFFVADNERWDKLIGLRTCKRVSKNFHGCTKSGFVSAVLRRRGMVTLIGRLQTPAINLVLRVKPCHLLWNPESVTCCDLGTASPLHQCSVRRWHMMDFKNSALSISWLQRLPGDAGGSLTSRASSMLHLDQHSALPLESIMGCDNTHTPFFFSFFINVDDAAAAAASRCRRWWQWLWWIGASKVDREPLIEIWCIQ